MVDEYKDRLAEAMRDANVTTAQLAHHLGISYQAVRKVLMGGQFGTDNNAEAARWLKVRSDWLATGKGPKKIGDAPATLSDWPFSAELHEQVRKMDPADLHFMEVAMWSHIKKDVPESLHYTESVTREAEKPLTVRKMSPKGHGRVKRSA